MDKKLAGKTEISYYNKNQILQIVRLYPYTETEAETTTEHIKTTLLERNVPALPNLKLLDWYINKAKTKQQVLQFLTIACGKCPIKMNTPIIEFAEDGYAFDNEVYWNFVHHLFDYLDETDLTTTLPFKLLYVKTHSVIATKSLAKADELGKSITGEDLNPGRQQYPNFRCGNNVYYDETKQAYIARASGYVMYIDETISVMPPFFITPDQMTLYFLNFDRTPAEEISKADIANYIIANKIDRSFLAEDLRLDAPIGTHLVIASGKQPGLGTDATLEFFVEVETKNAEVDENGQINYREVQKFPSVEADHLLMKKTLPIRGENGYDLHNKEIAARMPKDIALKCGLNIYKEETDTEILVYSRSEGLIEFKNNTISVFEQLNFPDDIDYKTGNVHTRVNVHINGSVRSGFKVKSEKNIFIKGTVEDNVWIEAGGDLIINGGACGYNNIINCNGNMSIKFIEGGRVFVKGSLAVQRYILNAEVECHETITVLGAGINLNERGAIIESKIFVRKDLFCPTIGCDSGLRTYVTFAYDKTRNIKIKNYEETLSRIKQQVEQFNEKYNIDFNSPTLKTKLKNLPLSQREEFINAILEKEKLDNQYEMIEGMLHKEIEKRKEDMANSNVQILKKVFPPLYLECENIKRVIDTDQPPSRFYIDLEEGRIERTRYAKGNKLEEQKEE